MYNTNDFSTTTRKLVNRVDNFVRLIFIDVAVHSLTSLLVLQRGERYVMLLDRQNISYNSLVYNNTIKQ